MLFDYRSADAEIDWSRIENYAGTLEILVSDRLPDLRPMSDCPQITSIRIEGIGNPLGRCEFVGLENIKQLSFHRIMLSCWKSLAKSKHLLALTLVDCNVKELSFLTMMLKLKRLQLRYLRPVFTDSFELNIDGLMAPGNLEQLEFVLTANISVPTILAVQYLPNIKFLAMDGFGFKNNFRISELSDLSLELLSLERNSFTQIPDLSQFALLRECWLGRNQIEKANLLSLTHRETPVNIYLDHNPIQEVFAPPFCRVHLGRDAKNTERKTADRSDTCNEFENACPQIFGQCLNQFDLHSVRQTLSFIGESLARETQWVVFEPNDPTIWETTRFRISSVLHDLFCRGVLKGESAQEAFFVNCDRGLTESQADIDAGIVRIEVGLAIFIQQSSILCELSIDKSQARYDLPMALAFWTCNLGDARVSDQIENA